MTAVPERLVVLVADDDENDLFIIRKTFQRLGNTARVIEVPDGDTAIAYLQGEGMYQDRSAWPLPNLLLLDQWMPRISGIDVLCWIRTEPRLGMLPVIILSGGLPPAQRVIASQLRAAFCPKEADLKTLMEAVGQAVGSAFGFARAMHQSRFDEVHQSLAAQRPLATWR